jgi:chromosome partitioning protein
MGKIITIVNQKGGVGKTTTAISLSHGLALAGFRVLAIDLDPQSTLSTWLGLSPQNGAYAMMMNGSDHQLLSAILDSKIRSTGRKNLSIISSDKNLSTAQTALHDSAGDYIKKILKHDKIQKAFDYILLDTAPTIGGIQYRAVIAADGLLVPIQCNFGGIEGFLKLYRDLKTFKEKGWEGSLLGVLPTMYDERADESERAIISMQDIFKNAPQAVFNPIHRAVVLERCAAEGKTIFEIEASSRAAQEYARLVDRVAKLTTS